MECVQIHGINNYILIFKASTRKMPMKLWKNSVDFPTIQLGLASVCLLNQTHQIEEDEDQMSEN